MKNLYIYSTLVVLSLCSCSAPQIKPSSASVHITADGDTFNISVPIGSSVRQALEQAGMLLGPSDRIEPDEATLVTGEINIRIIRVTEQYITEQITIPFEQQILQTESLPEKTTLIAQKGENGIKEITYRQLYEDGVEISKNIIDGGTIIKEPIPEIIMVGIQKPFTTYSICGRIAYLLGGNAWIMQETSSNRRPVITTGDLDGRIFSLSPDGQWLLFTRREDANDKINSLWVLKIGADTETDKIINLKVDNVVHYAGWVPGSTNLEIAFSTVEVRSTPPGWQANNDFNILSFSGSGWISKWKKYIDANSGGVYGWWGTNFYWNHATNPPNYVRPDGIGLVNLEEGLLQPLFEIIPYQTHADWAWIPGLSISPGGDIIYTLSHASQQGEVAEEESQVFDLTAITFEQGYPIRLISQVGMFAYPITSPFLNDNNQLSFYNIAYLQAIFPMQSDTSRYRVHLMDQDGSNIRLLFPADEKPGIDPQQVIWSPLPMPDTNKYAIAVVYHGNIFIIDMIQSSEDQINARQITGDGLVKKISWAQY